MAAAPKPATPTTVDEYIAQFPPEVQAVLVRIRATIKAAAPEAKESIAYRMPAYWQDGPLVYFAAFKKHVGFYPLPEAIEEFEARLAPYAKAKGSIQFPHGKGMPYGLIRDIVRSRIKANARKAAEKKKR